MMEQQASLDFGRMRGDLGAERAASKAQRVAADWMDLALLLVHAYSTGHGSTPFTMEICRSTVERRAPRPKDVDGRVWGHITRAAVKAGYIERVPGMFAQAASSNGSPKPCYRKGPRA
jgi:hypothetical protein